MTDIETDSVNVTILIKPDGDISITNLDYPSSGRVNTPFDISYDAVNHAEQENCFAEVVLGTIVLDRQEFSLNAGETYLVNHTLSFPSQGNKVLILRVGYID